jgi:murein DD-endopeptidase MepM/ murein hydrolase activator NlpD
MSNLVRLSTIASTSIIACLLGAIAYGDGSPSNGYEDYRLPWSEGTSELRSVGCPVGGNDPNGDRPDDGYCNGHEDSDHFAIDFSSMNDRQPVKAIGGGSITYLDQGDANFGRVAIVTHAGGFDSWYAHLCSFQVFVNGTPVNQGDWIGEAGNTGAVQPAPPIRCDGFTNLPAAHLHFLVNNSSGIAVNATLSGFSIQHLSDNNVGHLSNNSGPAYYTATQFDAGMRDKYDALSAAPGSTYSSNAGPCNNDSRWLHTCYVDPQDQLLTQNFIASDGTPGSLSSDPGGLRLQRIYE